MKKIGIFVLLLGLSISASGQEALDSKSFQGLELRGIGPALMSGRIADIAIHPRRRSTWYVAVGSGGSYALAAARVLLKHTQLPARAIVEEALATAADICIYTNHHRTIEEL